MGELDTTVGPLLVGILFNTYLYGLVTSQYLDYWNHQFNDALWIKITVILLLLVDTAHSIIGIYELWHLCVSNFTNPSILLVVDFTIPFTAIAMSTSGVITQIFLGHRVFQLTQSKPLAIVLGVLSTGGFVSGCIAGVKSGIIKKGADFGEIIPIVTCIFLFLHSIFIVTKPGYPAGWLTLLTSVDLLITGILIYVLSRSKTGFRRTDTIINRLIRGAIQTGLFASMFALADLFSFIFAPNTSFYAMFAFPIGRIYTTTLLNTLNARVVFLKMDQESDSGGQRWSTTTRMRPFQIQTNRLSSASRQTYTHTPETVDVEVPQKRLSGPPHSACSLDE